MDAHGQYYQNLKAKGLEAAVACEIIELTKKGKLAIEELNSNALDALKTLSASDAVAILQALSKKNIENTSNNSQRLCDMIKSRKESQKQQGNSQNKKPKHPKQGQAPDKQPTQNNRNAKTPVNPPPVPLLPTPGQGFPMPPPLMGQPPQFMPPPLFGQYIPDRRNYAAGHSDPTAVPNCDSVLDKNLNRLRKLSENTGHQRDFTYDDGFDPFSNDNFRGQSIDSGSKGHDRGRGGQRHYRGRGGQGNDRGRGGQGHHGGQSGQMYDRGQGGENDNDRNQGGQTHDRGRGGHGRGRGRGGQGHDRGRGGHGHDRGRGGQSHDGGRDGQSFDGRYGSTSNLLDQATWSNMNRKFSSEVNLSDPRRGKGGQRRGSARDGRNDDRQHNDVNDHGKKDRGGYRGNRGRDRRHGGKRKDENDERMDDNQKDSDDASDSSSCISSTKGSCSNLNDVDPKKKKRTRKRGGRGRKESGTDHPNDAENSDEDDVVDENDVFDFLLKECKGLVSFEEFQQNCHLFPPEYDIIKWLLNHRRRIRVYLKGKRVAHVGPFYRDATICLDHNRLFRKKGCKAKQCSNFHICKKFVAGCCKFGEKCIYGHDFKRNNNVELRKKLGLETFTDEELRILLRSRYPLLCSQFSHMGKCDNSENCPNLHLCKRYIIGKCGRESCKFGHDLKSSHNKWVLSMCDWIVPVMKDKEDFVKKVILIAHTRRQQRQKDELSDEDDEDDDNVLSDDEDEADDNVLSDDESLSDDDTETASVQDTSSTFKPVDRRNRFSSRTSAPVEVTSDSDARDGNDMPQEVLDLHETVKTLTAKVKDLEMIASQKPAEPEEATVVTKKRPVPKPRSTPDKAIQKSWLMDDAEKKPICIAYIEGTCTSCTKGHHPDIVLPYLWQIKHEQWATLDREQNQEVEREFCDGEEVIDTEILWDGNSFNVHICKNGPKKHKAVVFAINGSLVDSADSFPVRRLSTESYAGTQNAKGFYTQWRWYWKNDKNVWISYEREMFQKTLEVKYLFGQTSFLFTRTDYQFKYRIDFRTYKQVNLDTRKERVICRRPLFVSDKDVRAKKYPRSFELPASPEFPANFSPWDMTSDFELVELSALSQEFKKVKSKFALTMDTDRFEVTFIYRVQNRKLLNEYSTKKKNMEDDIMHENDNRDVGEKILFHGTDSIDICRAICTNNFDFRTSGKNATLYGEGSYFAEDAKYSHSYTKAGLDGQRYIFQANVLTGLTARGNSSYRRPPARPGQEHKLFDSCVDNEQKPNIFVIFDRSQSYPAHLIAYRELYDFAPLSYPDANVYSVRHAATSPSSLVNPSQPMQRNTTTRVRSVQNQQRFQASSEATRPTEDYSESQNRFQTSTEAYPERQIRFQESYEGRSADRERSRPKESCVLQ